MFRSSALLFRRPASRQVTLARKLAVALCITLLVFVGACSSSSGSGGSGSQPVATSANGCPTHNTRAFAKTRFVADAAIAAGVFKHWVYTPYQQGAFSKGAKGRVTSMVKAGIASAFALNRLNAAKQNAEGSPLLCNLTIGPITKFTSAISNLVHKGKSGTIDPADVTSANSVLTEFRSASTKGGAGFQDRNVPVPGLS